MRILLGALALALATPVVGVPAHAAQPDRERPRLVWGEDVVDADQGYRGLDAVNTRVAWIAGGSGLEEGGLGSVRRTNDRGRSWADVTPDTGGDELMFRDVEALSGKVALVLAIGPGEASRVYRTEDAGRHWTETFRNTDEAAFYNCMDFYPDGKRGLAVSDPVDGKFRILRTRDGGKSWKVRPDKGMPDSTGEFNFAASGDCLVIKGRHAWFGSGGAKARVFDSTNFGRTWRATRSTIPTGEAAGVFGLAFRTARQGLAVGGSFETPADADDASATTRDGRRWRNSAGDLPVLGEDAAWLPGLPGSGGHTVLAVGESGETAGTAISRDDGRTWKRFSKLGYHTLDCVDHTCWAAGGNGRVARFRY
jgi:photosystem II stability/assembly factor-like uncharacterized protein